MNFEGLLVLEQPLLKVPIESLRRTIRTSQKYIDKEITAIPGLLSIIAEQDVTARLESLKAIRKRMETLKRKLIEIKGQEVVYLAKTSARIAHLSVLEKIESADGLAYQRWSQQRLERVLADYFLRNGFESTATTLIEDTGIELLVDSELFVGARKIQATLLAKSCTEALNWCNDNKAALKKTKSPLEFKLRLQEYIELLKQNQILQALDYAKKHLTPFADTYQREIQQATALICFNPHTNPLLYQQFYQEARWSLLTSLFNTTYYSLSALPLNSLLKTSLQAGLASLKTPQCATQKNMKCPTCNPVFNQLAKGLMNSVKGNSCLICQGSGDVIGSGNLPLVLPNGMVYSQRYAESMTINGKVDVGGEAFMVKDVRKAFVM